MALSQREMREGDQVARLTDTQVQANSRKIELFL